MVKKSFPQFNLMVAGHSKAGKTDFIQTLFETVQVQKFIPETDSRPLNPDEIPPLFPLNVSAPTASTCSIECTPNADSNEKVILRLIDTPGLSIPSGLDRASHESIDALERYASDWVRGIVAFVEQQFAFTLEKETKLKRNPKERDTQVHACLYMLSPEVVLSNNGLTSMDIIALQGLCEKVNVIPCLAKSDLVSVRELKQLRHYLHQDFVRQGLKIYSFAEDEDTDPMESLIQRLPFCLVNSEELVSPSESKLREMGIMINDQKVLGREFIWGTMCVENPNHCDFNLLKTILFDTHMDDLVEMTREVFYEEWRTFYMKANSRSILFPADLTNLVQDMTLSGGVSPSRRTSTLLLNDNDAARRSSVF